jgi:hypothetical protein
MSGHAVTILPPAPLAPPESIHPAPSPLSKDILETARETVRPLRGRLPP